MPQSRLWLKPKTRWRWMQVRSASQQIHVVDPVALPADITTFDVMNKSQFGKYHNSWIYTDACIIFLTYSKATKITSGNCATLKRRCHYLTTCIPLRERRLEGQRLLPGQQKPWAVPTRLNVDNVVDPFDSLPIKMVFNSKELLYYCKNNLFSFVVSWPRKKSNFAI
jgi:hypothetical protein